MLKILLLTSLLTYSQTIKVTPNQFKLKEYGTNQTRQLKDYKGKKLLINFWATWCTSCIEETPLLNGLMKSEKAKDYNFIAINAGDSPKKIKRFIKKYKFKYNILQDRSRELSKSWGIDSLPITVILDSNGKVIYSGIRPPKSLL